MMRAGVAELQATYPGWDFTRGGGEWIATRGRLLTDAEISCGLRHVLTRKTITRLRGALDTQRRIEAARTEPAQ